MTGEMGSKFVRRGEGTEKGKGRTVGRWYIYEGGTEVGGSDRGAIRERVVVLYKLLVL